MGRDDRDFRGYAGLSDRDRERIRTVWLASLRKAADKRRGRR